MGKGGAKSNGKSSDEGTGTGPTDAADEKNAGGKWKRKDGGAKAKENSLVKNLFGLSTLSTLAAASYVYFAFSNLVNLMHPLRNLPADVVRNTPEERMVRPLWTDDAGGGGGGGRAGGGALGLRVYLSSEPEFSLDFLYENELSGRAEEGDEGEGGVVGDGKSFLLWSEDDAPAATGTFPSRSFVIVAGDGPNSCGAEGGSEGSGAERTCGPEQAEAQESIDFAHRWLEDAIEHEKQLQSDGGGLMAAMNSAGGGIESTSVLLTLYASVHKSVNGLAEKAARIVSGDGGAEEDAAAKPSTKEEEEEEEPKSVIYVSPRNSVWKSLMSSGEAYVHVLLVRQTPSPDPSRPRLLSASPDPRHAASRLQELHSKHDVLFGRVGMVKRELPLHVPSPKRLLYRDLLYVVKQYALCAVADDGSCGATVPPWDVAHHQPKEQEEYRTARRQKKEGVKYPYWKPEVMIHLIQDDEGYPLDYSNRVGFDVVRVGKQQSPGGSGGGKHASGYAYLPAVHVDEIGLTSDKYVPLNATVSALPLRIGFHGGSAIAGGAEGEGGGGGAAGLTPARYRLLNHLSSALESQAEMGFEQSDIDDLRRLIAETNVTLLAITILASVFHLLFEFLTRRRRFSLSSNSRRQLQERRGLLEGQHRPHRAQRPSPFPGLGEPARHPLLPHRDGLQPADDGAHGDRVSHRAVEVPARGGVEVREGRVRRRDGGGEGLVQSPLRTDGYELRATRLRAAAARTSDDDGKATTEKPNDLAALTEETDQLATRLLGKYFLLPLVTSYAVYSLAKEPHAGWYSWFITTASSFVYAVGFVLMTPQLFLNYKLKSVAHLPLGYRFVNTFIDDLFAFIIRMPAMARMSCFRDDVMFIIYLWQRYLYPVDSSRPVEGGGVGDVAAAVPAEDGKGKKGTKMKQP
ncbi:hypothetical protein ACHAWF_008412 [Thalassiosira exigua]